MHQTTGRTLQWLHVLPKKRVAAHLLSEDDDKDTFEKGCALIRHYLHIDPLQGSQYDWAAHLAQALWLDKRKQAQQAEMLARLLGEER